MYLIHTWINTDIVHMCINILCSAQRNAIVEVQLLLFVLLQLNDCSSKTLIIERVSPTFLYNYFRLCARNPDFKTVPLNCM